MDLVEVKFLFSVQFRHTIAKWTPVLCSYWGFLGSDDGSLLEHGCEDYILSCVCVVVGGFFI